MAAWTSTSSGSRTITTRCAVARAGEGAAVDIGPPSGGGERGQGHRPDGEAHKEEAAEAVEQEQVLGDLLAVAVDDPDRREGHEPVERVHLGDLPPVEGDERDAERHLDGDRDL